MYSRWISPSPGATSGWGRCAGHAVTYPMGERSGDEAWVPSPARAVSVPAASWRSFALMVEGEPEDT